jgi:cell division septal protein FtsQ
MPERRTSLRERRRKHRFLKSGALFLLIIVAVAGLHFLSYSPRFTIQTITVQGANKMPPDLVRSYAQSILDDHRFHFFSRRNIFLYPKSAIAHAVAENFPRIASASVSRENMLSNDLVIHITERQAFARWCQDPSDASQCLLMDEQGYIFADASDGEEFPSSSYRFVGGFSGVNPIGQTFALGHLPGIVALLKLLGNADFGPLGAALQGDNDFYVTLRQGFFIKASFGEDPNTLVRNLQLILQSDTLRDKTDQLEYVDLRFGNRVYFKLKGQDESPAQ